MKGTNMEDDAREIDWAEKKIRKLEANAAETAKVIDALSEELAGVQRTLQDHKARIEKLGSAKDRAFDLIGQLEERLNVYGIPQSSGRNGGLFEARPVLHAIQPSEPEFSPPVGGRKYQPDLDDELDGIPDVHGRPAGGVVPGLKTIPVEPGVVRIGHDEDDGWVTRIAGAAAMRREQYDRGFSHGRTSAMEQAEDRVRSYMDSHFSSGTIEAVIAAMQGRPVERIGWPIKDQPQG